MSGNNTIQHVITGSVQAIAAILPLLGTEQCEQHIGSGLIRGYLYVIATPISIFGSLGIAKAGFNILVASISFQQSHFLGAKMLANGGFKPTGDSSPMIAFYEANPDRFLAESKFLKMLKDENIENVEDLTVEWGKDTIKWNMRMIALSFVSVLGFTPYIYFVTSQSASSLLIHGWPFPVTRLLGSTISALIEQFIIQIRILQIVKSRLIFILVDRYAHRDRLLPETYPEVFKDDIWSEKKSSEICLWNLGKQLSGYRKRGSRDEHMEFNSQTLQEINLESLYDLHDYLKMQYKTHFPCNTMQEKLCGHAMLSKILLFSLQLFLFFAMVFSILGYIGTFYVIQNAPSGSIGPLLWLGLEVVLCLIRIVIWAYNPHWDDAKGMEFKLYLVKKFPLPTCDLSSKEFEKHGSAPFVRAKEFLHETAAFSGPSPSFIWEDTSLYFMLTRSQAPGVGVNDRELYLVLVHNKEQTSRLIVRHQPNWEFLIYYCSVKFHPKRQAVEVQTDFEHDSVSREMHIFTSNGEFMHSISEYYDQILQRYILNLKDFVVFPKSWNLNAVSTVVINRSNQELEEESIAALTMNLDSDTIYLNTGILKRQCFHLIDQISHWLELYLDLLQAQELYFEGEPEPEVDAQMPEFLYSIIRYLTKTFSVWKNFVLYRHRVMFYVVVEKEKEPGSTKSMKTIHRKLEKRLVDERQLFIDEFEHRVSENIDKLKAKFKVVMDKMELSTSLEDMNWVVLSDYHEMDMGGSAPIISDRIKRHRQDSQLNDIHEASDVTIIEYPNSALAKFWETDALKERIRFLKRNNKFLGINYDTFRNLDFLISALKAAGTITLVHFSSEFTVKNIIKVITEVTSITSVAKSRFDDKIPSIKDALSKNREQVTVLKHIVYYENVELSAKPDGSRPPILYLDILEGTNVSDHGNGWHNLGVELSNDSMEILSQLPYYHMKSLRNESDATSASINTGSENDPHTSVAVMKFEIEHKSDHTLILEHCFDKRDGYIVITMNDKRLIVKVSTPSKVSFWRKQEIILPQIIFNGPGQLNTLTLRAYNTPGTHHFYLNNYCLSGMRIRPKSAQSSD